jgi:hypothetical protein
VAAFTESCAPVAFPTLDAIVPISMASGFSDSITEPPRPLWWPRVRVLGIVAHANLGGTPGRGAQRLEGTVQLVHHVSLFAVSTSSKPLEASDPRGGRQLWAGQGIR